MLTTYHELLCGRVVLEDGGHFSNQFLLELDRVLGTGREVVEHDEFVQRLLDCMYINRNSRKEGGRGKKNSSGKDRQEKPSRWTSASRRRDHRKLVGQATPYTLPTYVHLPSASVTDEDIPGTPIPPKAPLREPATALSCWAVSRPASKLPFTCQDDPV